jgi:hypothetical protein
MAVQAEYAGLAGEFSNAAREHLKDDLIAICYFGSVARGEASVESDLDVLVVADGLPSDLAGRMRTAGVVREQARKSEAAHSLRRSGRSTMISSVYMTPKEVLTHPPILLDIADHGIIEFDKGNFLGNVLEDVRRRLRELGARKVRAKKGYYWILKPNRKPMEVIQI